MTAIDAARLSLVRRLHGAADAIEELSALYGYTYPQDVSWDARMLRNAADQLWMETPITKGEK